VILTTRFCLAQYVFEKHAFEWRALIKPLSKHFVTGITIVVVAVPEGLPLAVTIAFAYAVKKMMKDNNLVRHLSACETMGNATAICSDKTGTLTSNRMTVINCHIDALESHGKIPKCDDVSAQVKQLLCTSIAINSNYASKLQKPAQFQNGQFDIQIGNKTECALLGLAHSLAADCERIRSDHPIESLVHVYTFNSERKSMSTCIRHPELACAYIYQPSFSCM
jgi:Ca2+ transporting ATPase